MQWRTIGFISSIIVRRIVFRGKDIDYFLWMVMARTLRTNSFDIAKFIGLSPSVFHHIHSTYLMQPLDGHPFQAYKHYYRKKNNATVQWGGSVKEKRDFLREIHSIRMQTFKDRTVRHSFMERGIYPFQPDRVLGPLKKAKSPTPDLRIHGDTPPPSSSATNSPPIKIKRLRSSIYKAQDSF